MAATAPPMLAQWRAALAPFLIPHAGRATWQLCNTVGAYLLVWGALWYCVDVSFWLTAPLVLLAGALLVRVFIIFHDCGHGSLFASRRANTFWGQVTGLLTWTPFHHWRGEHAIHHGATGDLDRRGIGDVWTMTVQEYQDASRWRRLCYRLARNPVVLLVVAPLLLFVVLERIPRAGAKKHERRSVWYMTLAVLGMATGMSFLFGFWSWLVLQLAILMLAGAAGIWLFYMQHQFADAYWERGNDWDYVAAAMQGSSFLTLPRVLQWFSGNIGFHHIHHLDPRIPNYHLERCHRSDSRFESVRAMTMWSSVRSLGLRLWDESSKELVSFRQARRNCARRQR
ncbi:MAG: fatty acid desaturase [Planctomycetota bacterium]